MSAHNVEIVRRIYEQISARQALPGECFHPDCVTDFSRVSADGGRYRGVDASNVALASYFGTFEDFHVEAEEIVYADEHHVVAEIRDGGRIKGSDTEVTNRYFHSWTFRDGKVLRLSSHTDCDEALHDAGLEA